MNRRRTRARNVALCVMIAGGLPGWAIAQAPSATGVPTAKQPSESKSLAGPKVSPKSERATLVEIDFPGQVRRLESSPEEAAVSLLELSEEVRGQVQRVLTDRVKKLDAFVADNLLLLNQLDTAGSAGDKLDQLKLISEAVHQLAPVWRKGSLKSQIRAVLPEAARVEFDRLVEEYWVAIVRERQGAGASRNDVAEMKDAGSQPMNEDTPHAARGPKPKSRFEIITEERLASFGKEIERAFERQLASGNIVADYVIKAVAMSDDQKAKIRELCNDFADTTKMEATEKQRQELFVKIAGVLDTKQQLELAKLIQGVKKQKQNDGK